MIPIRVNRKLLIMAAVGILLYVAVIIWNIAAGEKMEDETSSPAVTHSKAEAAAVQFVSQRFGVGPADVSSVYANDKDMSAYVAKLQMEDEYDKDWGRKAPLDYWQVSVKDLRNGSLYLLRVDMKQAAVTAWSMAGHAVPRGAADRAAAEKTLTDMGYKTEDFTYIQPIGSSNVHKFESVSPAVGEARLLLSVEVKAGDVTAFTPAYVIPSSFVKWFSFHDTIGKVLSIVSLLVTVAFGITALVYAIMRSSQISFVRGILLTLIFTAVYVVSTFNTVPVLDAESTVNSQTMTVIYIGFMLFVILLMGAAVYFSVLAGNQLWLERGWNPWTRFRDSNFGADVFYGMGRGYLICLLILGVQQVLFLIAEKSFHSFGINDPSQSTLNMKWPLVFPTMAWMAGISEEILFRLFGIIILRKLLRNTFAAVLVSSFLWALGHAAYTIYPSYTRLFEVTVLGLIFGYTFLRYGLITAIFTHVTMDSILMAMSLAFTGKPNNILAGIGYVALPAVVGGILMILHSWFHKDKPPEEPEEPAGIIEA